MLKVTAMTVGILTAPIVCVAEAGEPYATACEGETCAGRKSVTVYADNETEAVARAEQSNSGWKAISAKKSSDDPKSRSWRVIMRKD